MTHSTNTFQYIKTNIWFQAVTQNPHQYMDFEDFLFCFGAHLNLRELVKSIQPIDKS